MFFRKWFKGIEADKKQLYQITDQVARLKHTVVDIETKCIKISDAMEDEKADNAYQSKLQHTQLTELYRTVEQITNKLTRLKDDNISFKDTITFIKLDIDDIKHRLYTIENLLGEKKD